MSDGTTSIKRCEMGVLTDFAIYGANILPSLAEAEQRPMPVFLSSVGNISAECTYNAPSAPVIQNVPKSVNPVSTLR